MKRKVLIITCCIISAVVFGIAWCYGSVVINAYGRIFSDVGNVPNYDYGLLLGTSPITRRGAQNYYFDNRIKAVVKLYNAGKIKYVIASGGDYSSSQVNGCDEPAAMRDSLVAKGIPKNRIILDYEGTRTLNSIAKVKEVYDIDSIVIISQKYHNERAIYLADKYGIHSVGYNAASSHILRSRVKNQAREVLARVKLMFDMIFGETPTFET